MNEAMCLEEPLEGSDHQEMDGAHHPVYRQQNFNIPTTYSVISDHTIFNVSDHTTFFMSIGFVNGERYFLLFWLSISISIFSTSFNIFPYMHKCFFPSFSYRRFFFKLPSSPPQFICNLLITNITILSIPESNLEQKNVVPDFTSVYATMKCDHSLESYRTVLSHGPNDQP